MRTLAFFTTMAAILFSYGYSDACHRFICIETDCLDTVIVCRQDRNSYGLDSVKCQTYDANDENRPQCRLDPKYGDIVIEQQCPLCHECPVCPKCPKCEECPTCEKCEECKECPECPRPPKYEEPDAGLTPTPDAGPTNPEEKEELAFAGGCSMSNNQSPVANTTLLFGIIAMICISFLRRSKKWIASCIGIITLCAGGLVYAFPTQNLKPAPGSFDYIQTQDGRVSLPSAKLFYHYERNPFVINKKPSNDRVDNVIETRHSLHILATASWDRFQLHLDLPVVLAQEQWPFETMQNGIGDIRLGVKARLYTYNSLNLALLLEGVFPTATADYVGSKNGLFSPQFIVSGRLGRVELAGNVGFLVRSDESFQDPGFQRVGVGQQFLASIAGRVPIVEEGAYGLSFVSDLGIATTLDNPTAEDVPLEWLNALSVDLPKGFNLMTGAGVSLTRGIGSPQPRVFASVGWAWEDCKKCKPVTRTIVKEKLIVKKELVVQHHLLTVPPIYFDTDKATLRPESKRVLDRVANMIKEYPQIAKLRIEGYCDHRASFKYNMALSKRRTKAAAQYLASKGVNITKMERRNFGETHQVNTDQTVAGMQENRRVEFYIRSR